MIDIDKLVKLKKQIEAALKIEESDKERRDYKTDSPDLAYALGKLEMLKDFKARLNDLIIQG